MPGRGKQHGLPRFRRPGRKLERGNGTFPEPGNLSARTFAFASANTSSSLDRRPLSGVHTLAEHYVAEAAILCCSQNERRAKKMGLEP